MPIPDAIWQALLANTQASGQSFNPWSLGAAAQPAAGGSLDDVIAEARARLSGGAIPAAPAAGAGTAEASAPMTELGGGPTALPGQGPLGAGQAYGYTPGAVQAGLNFVGLPAGLLGGLPAQAIISGAKALNSLPVVQDYLSEIAPFGVMTPGPTPAVISETLSQRGGLTGMLASGFGFGGVPTGVSFLDELGMPGGTVPLGSDRTSETGILPGFSGTLSGGLGVSTDPADAGRGSIVAGREGLPGSVVAGKDPDAPGAVPGATTGPGPSGGGPSPGDAGPGSATGGGTEAAEAHTGKRVKGKKGKEKTMRVLGGEQIMSNAATDAYGPLLDEMESSVGHGDLDSLMSKARAFWDV